MMPADQVVVPFRRSVWPAAKQIDGVGDGGLRAGAEGGRAGLGEVARPERGLAAPDGQRAVAAARAVAVHAQRAGAAVVVEVEDASRSPSSVIPAA